MKAFACPYFGQGAVAYDGKVTMKGPHGTIKTIECARWREGECTMCEREPDKEESGKEPHELHERK